MTDRTISLIENLRKAASIVRVGGDVYSDNFTCALDFASEIDRVADIIEKSSRSPYAYVYSYVTRKMAKYTWCAPSYDLDDYLAGVDGALELVNSIFEAL